MLITTIRETFTQFFDVTLTAYKFCHYIVHVISNYTYSLYMRTETFLHTNVFSSTCFKAEIDIFPQIFSHPRNQPKPFVREAHKFNTITFINMRENQGTNLGR